MRNLELIFPLLKSILVLLILMTSVALIGAKRPPRSVQSFVETAEKQTNLIQYYPWLTR